MKKIKFISCVTTLIFVVALFFSFTSAHAGSKRPVRGECHNPVTGELSGYHTDCDTGSGNCITTACGLSVISYVQ